MFCSMVVHFAKSVWALAHCGVIYLALLNLIPMELALLYMTVTHYTLNVLWHRWNIAWPQGSSRGQSPQNFCCLWLYFTISLLKSEYRPYRFLKIKLPVLATQGGQYRKSWFSVLPSHQGLYFLVLPRIQSNTGPYRPRKELSRGSTGEYTWWVEQY